MLYKYSLYYIYSLVYKYQYSSAYCLQFIPKHIYKSKIRNFKYSYIGNNSYSISRKNDLRYQHSAIRL